MGEAVRPSMFTATVLKEGISPAGIIDEARAQAHAMLEDARRQATQLLAEAEEAAQQRRSEVLAEAEAEIAARLAAALAAQQAALAQDFAGTREALADIVQGAVRKLVGRTCGEDVLLPLVEEAMRDFEPGIALYLHVNVADQDRVREGLHQVLAYRTLTVVGDASVNPGTALLTAGNVRITLGLEPQLEILKSILTGREA